MCVRTFPFFLPLIIPWPLTVIQCCFGRAILPNCIWSSDNFTPAAATKNILHHCISIINIIISHSGPRFWKIRLLVTGLLPANGSFFTFSFLHSNGTLRVSSHLGMCVDPLLLKQLNVSLQFGDANVLLSDLLHAVLLDLLQTRELPLQMHQPLIGFQHLWCSRDHDKSLSKEECYSQSSE